MDPPTEDEVKVQAKEVETGKALLPPSTDPQADDTSNTELPEMPASPPPPPLTEFEDAQEEIDEPKEEDADDAKVEVEGETTQAKPLNLTPALTETPAQDEGTLLKETKDPQAMEERRIQFLELRSYEAKRRTVYTSKMKSTNLYWRAFRDMLSKAYEETDRAENLVSGTLVANQAYVGFLQAAAEDRLDHAGKPVDKRRGQRLKADRAYKYSSLGGEGFLLGMSLEQNRQKIESQKSQDTDEGGRIDANNASFDGLPDNSMLNTLIQSQLEMADVMTENVDFIKDIVLVKLHSLRRELESEVTVMGALGDATMFELKKAEDDVQKAWAAYYSLAALVDMDKDSPRIQKATGKGMNPNAITDVWLVEMHYRMAVAYLTTVWEKSSSELANLFAGTKEMECNRRFRLRELLNLFTARSERMWTSIPPLLKPAIDDLGGKPIEIKVLEKEVSEKIRAKAQELQKMDEAIITTDPLNGPGLAGVPEPDENFELQSPLMSDLLCKVEVIWRKSDKIMSVWKPCLAATTSDCYLHLFEIPAHIGSTVQTGTSPEVAFQALVPPVEVPTEDAVVDGVMPNAGKSWFQDLVPGSSLDLKNSNISFNQQKGNSTFEITETLAPSGFSKISKNVRRRKFSLRLFSSQHMVEWLLALRALGAE